MLKLKSLCILGVAAALMLSGCSSDNKENNEHISSNEGNITDGNVSVIVDPTEGEKAELTRPPEAARRIIKIGMVKNDPGAVSLASLIAENEDDAAFEKYTVTYAENYSALADMMRSKQFDVAVMPPAKALEIYASDKSVKVLASLTSKSYSLVGSDIASLADMSGKKVYMSSDDKTSACIFTKLMDYAGVTDCEIAYVQDSTALFNAVKSGDADYALMTEPYISMLKQEGIALGTYDFKEDWQRATEGNDYCSGSIVATNEFITQQRPVVDYMLADMQRSLEAVNTDAGSCAALAAKYGIADDAKALEAAYTSMDCGFFKERQMRYLVNNMFTIFDNASPELLGTDIPGEDFYFVTETSE